MITLSRDTRHNSDVPSIGWRSLIAFHFPLPKKAAMLSQPMIEFTPRRAPQEAVVNIAWVELHIMFTPLPFFMLHLFKVNFLLWASIRRRTSVSVSVYQSASHCTSFLRACRAWRTRRVSAFSSRNCTSETGSLITMCLPVVARLVLGCHTGSPWSSCRVCF